MFVVDQPPGDVEVQGGHINHTSLWVASLLDHGCHSSLADFINPY